MTAYFVCIILTLFASISAVDITQNRHAYCYGFVFRRDNGGIIFSHREYGQRLYQNNAECFWVIKAPFNKKVLMQPIKMSIEYDKGCNFDSLQVFDGSLNSKKSIGKYCGGDNNFRAISTNTTMTVLFKSDSSINKEGFVIRYFFINQSDPNIDFIPTTTKRKTCLPWEVRCKNKKQCIMKSAVCDKIADCEDGSDETKQNCKQHGQGRCHSSQKSCPSGKCVDKRKWCDGIPHCEDGVDEDPQICKPGESEPPPIPTKSENNADFKCGIATIKPVFTKDRIVGGEIAKSGSWPWMVSLRIYGGHVCGGSIVNKRWIVTAAHCTYDSGDLRDWGVEAGAHKSFGYQKDVQRKKVAKIIMHPQYNDDLVENDIALIQLTSDLVWTDRVSPVCLPDAGETKPQEGTECIITGWGDTLGTGGEDILKQAKVPIVSTKQCNEWYGGITAAMMCAGYREGKTDACQGDSGGPLVCKKNGVYKLYGATSWGDECAAPKKPGVYTNIVRFTNWVNKIISKA